MLVLCAAVLSAAEGRAAFEVRWPEARDAAMLTWGLDLSAGLPERSACRASEQRPGPTVTASAGELYGLPEARGWAARVVMSVGRTETTVRASGLGGGLYAERDLGLSLKWPVGHDAQLEVGLRGLGVGADGVPTRWTAAVDAGASRRLLGRILAGVRCENVGGSAIGQSRLTSAYGFGVALLLSGISLQATTRVQDRFEATHSLGLEVDVTEWARMRAGAACEPGRFACGLGIGTSLWPSVDLAWQWHPKLGGSTFVSVVLRL